MTSLYTKVSKHRLRLLGATTFGLGATYLYYKPASVAPPIPYIPPPFVWESIPKPILKRFSGHEQEGMLWKTCSKVVVAGAGLISKGFLNASQTTVYGLQEFLHIVQDPHRTKGLITVSNHESVLDDPLLWGVLPMKTFLDTDRMRWVLGAADICYTTIFKSYFFVFGKTIPTIRGGGIYQPGVDFAIDQLNKGGWIHIYPEAKVSQEKKMIRFKWGVARMMMETEPVVIPMWHSGMKLAKPLYGTRLVHLHQPIVIAFGEPIEYTDILEEWKNGTLDRETTRIRLTQRVYDALEKLETCHQNNSGSN